MRKASVTLHDQRRGGELSNKRMQLTKRGPLCVGAPSRAFVIESRFAADPWCSTDTVWALRGRDTDLPSGREVEAGPPMTRRPSAGALSVVAQQPTWVIVRAAIGGVRRR
jgi:hypothetical protein